MTGERNFRDEALSARRAARETLLAYREARLRARRPASSRPSPSDKAVPGSQGDDSAQIGPETFFAMPPAPPGDQSSPIETSDGPDQPSETISAETEDPVLSAPDEAYDDPDAIEAETSGIPAADAADGDVAEQPEAPMMSEGIPTLAAEESAVNADATESAGPELATVDPDSDLFRLPGAGAGMIWMFHQCDIRSLDDLADADARDLSSRLGVVGHILNIEPWIVFARQNRSAPA